MPKIAIEIVIEAQLIAYSTHSTTDTESERQTKRERERASTYATAKQTMISGWRKGIQSMAITTTAAGLV